ncbi:hypothetical protein GYMLUDRAFT_221605 [Collybiopsis luxurians FD-317 M1]|uniref:ABC transporter domain-containing protein n=1 Tax=Collybiopsis luxurians FD-317 M1 TaxID=944289 RepID=A0A0D0CWK6_9AGAR|nr:hypothetical protein GYMLUDRAFT_221605 [Collybiopsis luxurians FD-317 M1]
MEKDSKTATTTTTTTTPQPKEGIETLYVGVYRVLLEKSSIFKFDREKWVSSLYALLRFVKEVYFFAPQLLVLVALLDILRSQEEVVFLVFETRILRNIEYGLKEGAIDVRALVRDIACRILWIVATAFLQWWGETTRQSLRTRTVHYFDGKILAARLKTDLPTLDANLSDDHISASAAWYCLETLISLFARVTAIFSQLAFILRIARSNQHGLIYAGLCVIKPVLYIVLQKSLWAMPRVVEAINTSFLRMRALRHMGEKKFKLDVTSSDLEQYIVKEFHKAQESLGDTPTDSAEMIHWSMTSPRRNISISLAEDFPMLYLVAVAFFRPRDISLATMALLQESSGFLKMSFSSLFYEADTLRKRINVVEQLFNLEKKASVIKDGDLRFPLAEEKGLVQKGLHIELRNVSFTYPGTKSTKEALSDVSLTIQPGQLVVIVGSNGCGKSTLLKLLTRLYDVNSGTVFIDGEDIRKYCIADLRQSMTTLTQDHNLFPLSIAENIGLGFAEEVDNEEMIEDAAKKGGAAQVVAKLDKGMKTVLEPRAVQYSVQVTEDDGSALAKELKALDKAADVSGGERQRLVASRTFMRFNSGKIRFMAVDEPSSALDPEGELELFNNFREAREGKTMIFITHRFGHLTKYADQIICMKEGKIVESGVHEELMKLDGEYAKMYNIQARAFEN